MRIVERKYGNNGFAVWIKILERLTVTDFHYLDLRDQLNIYDLSDYCNVEEDLLIEIIDFLCQIGEIDPELWSQKIVWIQRLTDSLQDAYKKRTNDCITYSFLLRKLASSGVSVPGNSVSGPLNPVSGSGNAQSKVKKSKVEKRRGEKRKKIAPSFEKFVEDPNQKKMEFLRGVIDTFNLITGSTYKNRDLTIIDKIQTLFDMGYTNEDLSSVIQHRLYLTTKKDTRGRPIWRREWVTPHTIFDKEKFPKYYELLRTDIETGTVSGSGNDNLIQMGSKLKI